MYARTSDLMRLVIGAQLYEDIQEFAHQFNTFQMQAA